MRASARLHADDAIAGQRLATDQKFHVLTREDVVRDDAEPVTLAHRLAERIDQRRFSGTDGSTDADADRALDHDRNNLACRYCCAMADTSIAGVKDSGRARVVMASTTIGTRPRTLASCAWASVWPIRINRNAADVVDASRVYAKAAPASCIPTPAAAHAQPNAIGRPGPRRCARARSRTCWSRRWGYRVLHVVASRSPIARLARRVADDDRMAVSSSSSWQSAGQSRRSNADHAHSTAGPSIFPTTSSRQR